MYRERSLTIIGWAPLFGGQNQITSLIGIPSFLIFSALFSLKFSNFVYMPFIWMKGVFTVVF